MEYREIIIRNIIFFDVLIYEGFIYINLFIFRNVVKYIVIFRYNFI